MARGWDPDRPQMLEHVLGREEFEELKERWGMV